MFSCNVGKTRPGLAGLALVLLTGALVGRRRARR
jgi:MYXO-CTERM domain-containing protein